MNQEDLNFLKSIKTNNVSENLSYIEQHYSMDLIADICKYNGAKISQGSYKYISNYIFEKMNHSYHTYQAKGKNTPWHIRSFSNLIKKRDISIQLDIIEGFILHMGDNTWIDRVLDRRNHVKNFYTYRDYKEYLSTIRTLDVNNKISQINKLLNNPYFLRQLNHELKVYQNNLSSERVNLLKLYKKHHLNVDYDSSLKLSMQFDKKETIQYIISEKLKNKNLNNLEWWGAIIGSNYFTTASKQACNILSKKKLNKNFIIQFSNFIGKDLFYTFNRQKVNIQQYRQSIKILSDAKLIKYTISVYHFIASCTGENYEQKRWKYDKNTENKVLSLLTLFSDYEIEKLLKTTDRILNDDSNKELKSFIYTLPIIKRHLINKKLNHPKNIKNNTTIKRKI